MPGHGEYDWMGAGNESGVIDGIHIGTLHWRMSDRAQAIMKSKYTECKDNANYLYHLSGMTEN